MGGNAEAADGVEEARVGEAKVYVATRSRHNAVVPVWLKGPGPQG